MSPRTVRIVHCELQVTECYPGNCTHKCSYRARPGLYRGRLCRTIQRHGHFAYGAGALFGDNRASERCTEHLCDLQTIAPRESSLIPGSIDTVINSDKHRLRPNRWHENPKLGHISNWN
jgi:hypothetical protein